MSGSQIHAVRFPSYVISAEIIFGMPDQRLTIRHNSGNSARPYVDGALLAIRKVSGLVGVHRGLDTVLDLSFKRGRDRPALAHLEQHARPLFSGSSDQESFVRAPCGSLKEGDRVVFLNDTFLDP